MGRSIAGGPAWLQLNFGRSTARGWNCSHLPVRIWLRWRRPRIDEAAVLVELLDEISLGLVQLLRSAPQDPSGPAAGGGLLVAASASSVNAVGVNCAPATCCQRCELARRIHRSTRGGLPHRGEVVGSDPAYMDRTGRFRPGPELPMAEVDAGAPVRRWLLPCRPYYWTSCAVATAVLGSADQASHVAR